MTGLIQLVYLKLNILFVFKCEETCLISESSGLYKSKDVALDILKTIKKGSYSSFFGINGFLLNCLTIGTGPATNFTEAILQVNFLDFFLSQAFKFLIIILLKDNCSTALSSYCDRFGFQFR